MMALHPLAQFCVVSSLDDGMNLVAKEFVASRADEDGVLILIRFTGAGRELTDAVLVNPFAVDEIADAMLQALTMPDDERHKHMQRLRARTAGGPVPVAQRRRAVRAMVQLVGVELSGHWL
jgi:trehalose 6-phosphate synthase